MTDTDRFYDDEVLLSKHIFLSEPHATYYVLLPPVVDFDTNIDPSKPVLRVRAIYRFDGQSQYGFRHEFLGVEVVQWEPIL